MTGKKRMMIAYSLMLGSIVVSAEATVISLYCTNNLTMGEKNESSTNNNNNSSYTNTNDIKK